VLLLLLLAASEANDFLIGT